MSEYIGFFGSNSRPLYVEDIYRSLSLPNGYVIQYRYDEKNISNDILRDYKDLINSEGIIFYYYKPDIEVEKGYIGTITDCTKPQKIPIRKVKIVDVDPIKNINKMNFYLELGEFIDCEIHASLNLIENSPEKEQYVTKLFIQDIKSVQWLYKIEQIKDYFRDVSFFYIKSINLKNQKSSKLIQYDSMEKRTNLHLKDDESYIFDFLTYDKTEGKLNINIERDKNYLDINSKLEKGTKVDSKKLTIETRSIDFKKNSTYLTLSIKDNKEMEYSVNLSIKIQKKLIKSAVFGFFSSIVLIGIPLGNLLTGSNFSWSKFGLLGIPFTIILIASTILHRLFNKK